MQSCEHKRVEDARSGAGKLIAFVCLNCAAVLCPACKGNAHPPDDIDVSMLRGRGYCACRHASNGVKASHV